MRQFKMVIDDRENNELGIVIMNHESFLEDF